MISDCLEVENKVRKTAIQNTCLFWLIRQSYFFLDAKWVYLINPILCHEIFISLYLMISKVCKIYSMLRMR